VCTSLILSTKKENGKEKKKTHKKARHGDIHVWEAEAGGFGV
jgi:hypothetical protein